MRFRISEGKGESTCSIIPESRCFQNNKAAVIISVERRYNVNHDTWKKEISPEDIRLGSKNLFTAVAVKHVILIGVHEHDKRLTFVVWERVRDMQALKKTQW